MISLATGQVMTALRVQKGALSAAQRKQVAGVRKRAQNKERTHLVPAELQGTFGGV